MSDVVADLTIDGLAQSELELRERVLELEADIRTYRDLAHEAIHALYGKTVAGERQRQRYERLLAEYRAVRAQLRRPTVAA